MRQLRTCIVLLLTVAALNAAAETDWYWRLGDGLYYNLHPGMRDLDAAMYDWLVVNYQTDEVLDALARYQQLNPDQQYLIRISGPHTHLGRPGYAYGTATCLDHLLDPEKGALFEERLRTHLRRLRNHAEAAGYWNKVFAFTFLEELPGTWGVADQVSWQRGLTEDGIPSLLEEFRPAIEARRGKPLVWDQETWLWMGDLFVESLNRVHAIIKEETADKLVLFWHHGGYGTLAEAGGVPDNAPTAGPIYPFDFTEIIGPGLADGLMAGSGRDALLEQRIWRFTREHNWPWFGQLSHPARMRLISWADALAQKHRREPGNLGYFFYTEGRPDHQAWNADSSVPPDLARDGAWPVGAWRVFAAQQQIGRDVLERAFRVGVRLDYDLRETAPDRFAVIHAVIENPREALYYRDADAATLRDVRATIGQLRGAVNHPINSCPDTVTVGDLGPGECRTVEWWLKTAADFRPEDFHVTVTAVAANSAERHCEGGAVHRAGGMEWQEVRRSRWQWNEPSFRAPDDAPHVDIIPAKCLRGLTLTTPGGRIRYEAPLYPGERLTIVPTGHASKGPAEILPDLADQLRDGDDWRTFSSGWGPTFRLDLPLVGNRHLRLAVAGQIPQEHRSFAEVVYRMADGTARTERLLDGRLGAEWSTVETEFAPPEDAITIERLGLRRGDRETWPARFGQPSLQWVMPESLDVSEHLRGDPVRLPRRTMTPIEYTDDGVIGGGRQRAGEIRCRIRVYHPQLLDTGSKGEVGRLLF